MSLVASTWAVLKPQLESDIYAAFGGPHEILWGRFYQTSKTLPHTVVVLQEIPMDPDGGAVQEVVQSWNFMVVHRWERDENIDVIDDQLAHADAFISQILTTEHYAGVTYDPLVNGIQLNLDVDDNDKEAEPVIEVLIDFALKKDVMRLVT